MDKKHINWTNTLFLSITPLAGIIGTVLLAINHQIHSATIWLACILCCLGAISITAGYHRLFSHCTYKAAKVVQAFFVLFGSSVFEGSVLEWSTDHRNHHRYVDTPKDPYNINQGAWHAHIGWLLTMDASKRKFDNIDDLKTNKLLQWQHKNYRLIAFFMAFLLPTLIAGLWGDWLGGLIIAGALRISFNLHCTFCINSLCHLVGKQTYTDKQSARDHWFAALLTMGEGYHNFHHQFALDYRNGVRYYQFDPTKWLINFLFWVGLAEDLKRVSQEKIVRYRVDMEHKRVSQSQHSFSSLVLDQIQEVKSKLMEQIAHIETLERDKRVDYQAKMTQARKELSIVLDTWKRLLRTATSATSA